MDPRIRPAPAATDPRVGPPGPRVRASTRPLDGRILSPARPSPMGAPPPVAPDDFGDVDLPDPGPTFERPPPGWHPTVMAHACPENLPGEYRRPDVALAFTVTGSHLARPAEIYRAGASLLAAADIRALDEPLATFLPASEVPNGAVALLDDRGRLVHCSGLTNLGAYQGARAQPAWAGPRSAFRVGSVSKTFTAWAVARLADLGAIGNMQDRLSDYVDLERVPEAVERGLVGQGWIPGKGDGRTVDSRRERITLKHILTHRGVV